MYRYEQLFEYDPQKMRDLYGNSKSASQKQRELPDWYLNSQQGLRTRFESIEVVENKKYISKRMGNFRAVLWNGNIYMAEGLTSIHLYIIGWLVYYRGMEINAKQYEDWWRGAPVPFFCIHVSDGVVYHAESYVADDQSLFNLLRKNFKKEVKKLKSFGCDINLEDIFNETI